MQHLYIMADIISEIKIVFKDEVEDKVFAHHQGLHKQKNVKFWKEGARRKFQPLEVLEINDRAMRRNK